MGTAEQTHIYFIFIGANTGAHKIGRQIGHEFREREQNARAPVAAVNSRNTT